VPFYREYFDEFIWGRKAIPKKIDHKFMKALKVELAMAKDNNTQT
jgi:hypothetical protein